jgi:rhodanese-related sulfurtransferase
MLKFLTFIFFGFLLFNYAAAQTIDKKYDRLLKVIYSDFPTISTTIANEKLKEGQAIFLDTREKEEYDVCHLPNAIWIGYEDFDIKPIASLDKTKEIIVYCSIGARSQNIGKKLLKAGFKNVSNLYGGIFQWSNEERILVDKQNIATKKIHGYSKNWKKWIKKGEIVL